MRIAVYGATGFTAKLVLAELVRRRIDPVLAGRDAGRLRVAATTVGVPDAPVRTAGIDEPAALADAFRDCDAVINCVAPFTTLGEPVVRAAIDAGCHYVDITGEQQYLKAVFDTFGAEAEKAGVTVVPAMTDDGLPGDLITHLVAEQVPTADRVTVADLRRPSAGASWGTARTAVLAGDAFRGTGIGYRDGEWRTGLPARRDAIAAPGEDTEVPVVTFALPSVVTVPRHVRARRVEAMIRAEVANLFRGITPELVAGMADGPDEVTRRTGRWLMLAEATGGGRTVRGWVEGSDVYGSTAVIAVAGAVRLAIGDTPAGVLAPAQAFDPAGFLNSLAPHGVRWTLDR